MNIVRVFYFSKPDSGLGYVAQISFCVLSKQTDFVKIFICGKLEYSYCRTCLTGLIGEEETGECPVCRRTFSESDFKKPPLFMRTALSEVKLKCEFVEKGCGKVSGYDLFQFHKVADFSI